MSPPNKRSQHARGYRARALLALLLFASSLGVPSDLAAESARVSTGIESIGGLETPAVYLENEFLRICVLPSRGAWVHSVRHKNEEIDLFHRARSSKQAALRVTTSAPTETSRDPTPWLWASQVGSGKASLVLSNTEEPGLRTVVRFSLQDDTTLFGVRIESHNFDSLPWDFTPALHVAHPESRGTRPLSASLEAMLDANRIRGLITRSGDSLRATSSTEAGGFVRTWEAKAAGDFKALAPHGARSFEVSWFPVWAIGACDAAGETLALSAKRIGSRPRRQNLELGICAAQRTERSTILVRTAQETLYRIVADLDPAKPWKKIVPLDGSDEVRVEIEDDTGRTLLAHTVDAAETEPRARRTSTEAGATQPPKQQAASPGKPLAPASSVWRLENPQGVLAAHRSEFKKRLSRRRTDVEAMLGLARTTLRELALDLSSDPDVLEKKFSAALSALKRAPRTNGRAHLYSGMIWEGRGVSAKAAGEYRAALKSALAAPTAGVRLARVLTGRKGNEALDAATVAAAACPGNHDAQLTLAIALSAADALENALSIAQKVASENPADPVALRLVEDLLRRLGREEQAATVGQQWRALIEQHESAARAFTAELLARGLEDLVPTEP